MQTANYIFGPLMERRLRSSLLSIMMEVWA
jgi:hypothetical protein